MVVYVISGKEICELLKKAILVINKYNFYGIKDGDPISENEINLAKWIVEQQLADRR